jgi:tetrahydromethanopterin S-methyltransferase subunit D
MKKFFQNKSWQILGGLLGGIAGYFYWKEIGCVTGTCPITSKPMNSIIYFSVLAYFVTGTISGFSALKNKNGE